MAILTAAPTVALNTDNICPSGFVDLDPRGYSEPRGERTISGVTYKYGDNIKIHMFGADIWASSASSTAYTLTNASIHIEVKLIDAFVESPPSILSASDKIIGSDRSDRVFAYHGSDTVTGGSGNDLLHGGAGADVLRGGDHDDTMYGGAGNDRLNGGAGTDWMQGGGGNDQYVVDSAADTTVEQPNAGTDTIVSYVSLSLALRENVEHLTLAGSASTSALGNVLNNRLTGNAGENQLNGRDGNDILSGAAGNDTLDGGSGDDKLTGGAGNDEITCGDGDDRVRYTSALDGHDVILDFDGDAAGGHDVLVLDALFDSLGIAASNRAGHVNINDLGNTVEVSVNADGKAGFELLVATLKTADDITKGQDVIVGT